MKIKKKFIFKTHPLATSAERGVYGRQNIIKYSTNMLLFLYYTYSQYYE